MACILKTAVGQVPFECKGRGYRVIADPRAGTHLQELQQNEDRTITFTDLHYYPDYEINAIAYHPTQNVIYGIIQNQPYRLCRIDAEFNLDILQTLPLPTDLVFVSGDISPDERFLVLSGFGPTRGENIFALVDVQNESYSTEILPIRTNNPDEPTVYCADIAFHPTSGKLFGYDFRNNRLVTLDINNRIIDNTTYPVTNDDPGNVPSIFFNDQGELYGIGNTTLDSQLNRTYYQFDLSNGQNIVLEELEIERNQDACSCPYRIELLNEVRQRNNAPCTELAFEMTLINRTDIEQFDLTLIDTFPEGVVIKDIDPLPFSGTIESAVGSNILSLSKIHLPIGTFSFEIIFDIQEDVEFGTYMNQAFLTGLRLEDFELESVVSDDPVTTANDDATLFSINGLSDPCEDQFFGIGKGGQTTLHAGIYGAKSYEWSTGENTTEITVFNEGDYQITITTECDQITATATVELDEIGLNLGDDQIIESGAVIVLEPQYTSTSPINSFSWSSSDQEALDCPSCEKPSIQPSEDTDIELTIDNMTGCEKTDGFNLDVTDVTFFEPNIFTPNNDNRNDFFFLQGNLNYDLALFQIYDAWGGMLYQKKNIVANREQDGWDGTTNGHNCSPGVYLWTAVVKFKNGQERVIRGDITLIR